MDLAKLGIDRAIRFGYAGCLLLVLAIALRLDVPDGLGRQGDLISLLLVVAGGAGFYSVYQYLIGHLFLFRLAPWLHRRVFKRTDILSLLEEHDVGEPYDAYLELRSAFFDDETRTRLRLIHSEIHVIYLTGVGLLGAGLVACFVSGELHAWVDPSQLDMGRSPAVYVSLGVMFLMGAGVADVRQLVYEGRAIAPKLAKAVAHLKAREYVK